MRIMVFLSAAWITWHRKYRHSWSAVLYVEGCHQQTCCSYKDDLTQAHKTVPGMNSDNFLWLPKGKYVGNINIFDCTVKIHVLCPANCLLHHCDSIHRSFIIKCWLFSSCILYVCSFRIKTHFPLRTVNFVHLVTGRARQTSMQWNMATYLYIILAPHYQPSFWPFGVVPETPTQDITI